ncbi:MAG: hypothetical protein ACLR2E_16155 [Lachnospiraceae bacterium]
MMRRVRLKIMDLIVETANDKRQTTIAGNWQLQLSLVAAMYSTIGTTECIRECCLIIMLDNYRARVNHDRDY